MLQVPLSTHHSSVYCLYELGLASIARSMAIFMLGGYMIALPLLPGGASNTDSPTKGTRALTDIPFWVYVTSTSSIFITYLLPYFYMPSFSQTILHTSASAATHTLVVSQASSVPDRLAAAVAAHYLGVMVLWVSICVVVSGLRYLSWIFVHINSAYLAFCTLCCEQAAFRLRFTGSYTSAR
jgi:hypothetical protein